MQKTEEVKEMMNTSIRQKISTKTQILLVLDVILVGFIIFRIGTQGISRSYIDWVTNILFWSLLIVSALLILEVLIMSFFKDRLLEAPVVMWGMFFIVLAINTLIVIITLIWMGFLIRG